MKLVPLHVHEVELVLDPMFLDWAILLNLPFNLSQIRRYNYVGSLKGSPFDVAQNLNLDNFSDRVAETVVFFFFHTNEFWVVL